MLVVCAVRLPCVSQDAQLPSARLGGGTPSFRVLHVVQNAREFAEKGKAAVRMVLDGDLAHFALRTLSDRVGGSSADIPAVQVWARA